MLIKQLSITILICLSGLIPGAAQVIPLAKGSYHIGAPDSANRLKFDFIDPYLRGKRIVLLGEDHPMVSEYNYLNRTWLNIYMIIFILMFSFLKHL